MPGTFSYVSLAPRRSSSHNNNNNVSGESLHQDYNNNRNSRQLPPMSQHHVASPSPRPVSPLEPESDAASAHLQRSVSLATTKSAQLPVVAVHPVIAEEATPRSDHQQLYSQPRPQQHHGQPGEYKTVDDYGTAPGPYGGDTVYYGYQAQQPHHQQQEQQQYGYDHQTGATYDSHAYQSQPPPPPPPPPPAQFMPFASNNNNSNNSNNHAYRVFAQWMWELITLVLIFALLWAIGILLATYDTQPVPDWGRYINLNTLLALLSTIFRAGLVVIITSVISQRKWSWFAATEDHHHHRLHSSSTSGGGRYKSKPRSLGHIQKYDQGSRNSFKAIWLFGGVLGGRDMIALAAAVVFLLSFLVGPFVQQASQTLSCSVMMQESSSGNETSGASMPVARFVPRAGGYVRGYAGTVGNPTSETIVALLSSATAPKGVENRVVAICSTGNCTFSEGDPVLGGGGGGGGTGIAKTNRRATSSSASNSSSTTAGDLALPFLAHPVDSPGSDLADFLSTTHSTVGVCHLCSDISSAVGRRPSSVGQSAAYGTLLNMSVSANSFSPVLNMTSTMNSSISGYMRSLDLEWLAARGLLSPAQARASKYALQNTTLLMMTDTSGKANASVPNTILPKTYLAAACNLYPCLRTFSSAVEGGRLREIETADSANVHNDPVLRAQRQMWPAKMGNLTGSGLDYLSMSGGKSSSFYSSGVFYGAIKSPCRVYPASTGNTSSSSASSSSTTTSEVYTRQNMSLAPDAVDMVMYQPRILDATMLPIAVASDATPNITKEADYHWVQYRVPETCVYRHDSQFHMAVASVLEDSILSGDCTSDPRTGPRCKSPIAGGDQLLMDIYDTGLGSMARVDAWFGDFAGAITARYRSQFGAGAWNASDLVKLPEGEVQGQVWLASVCMAAEMKWLAFPGGLLLLTAVLLGWTVWGNWKQRRERPVWKDSLLPLLFYYGRFREQEAGGPQHGLDFNNNNNNNGGQQYPQGQDTMVGVQQGKLLEAKEMQDIADRTMVTFDWPTGARGQNVEDGGGMGAGTGYSGAMAQDLDQQHDEKDVPQPRRLFSRMPWHRRLSADSLLDQSAQR